MTRKNSEDLRDLVKSVRDRSFPYEKREEKERNWHNYDQVKVNEIADVLETIRDILISSKRSFPRPYRDPDPSEELQCMYSKFVK